MLSRSSLLSVLLLAANVAVAVRTYQVWMDRPWGIPEATEVKPLLSASGTAQIRDQEKAKAIGLASTDNIIHRNLFDPERGTGETQANKAAEALALATQRLRAMALVGTAILDESRYAVLEEPVDPRLQGPRPQLQPEKRGEMRHVKLGDTLEGFRLSSIEDRKVVFENGAYRVEMAVDYLRKVADFRGLASAPPGLRAEIPGQSVDPDTPAPPLAPRFPRRDARQ